ncbi:metal-dependent hydrolase [Acinetobacter venetianus]
MQPSRHIITARKVQFDFSNSNLVWIPNDPFSSHLINGVNLLLPAGEFWFCRVFNKALPYIEDANLREDVIGFIKQEAIHANAHVLGQNYLEAHNVNIEEIKNLANTIFGTLLSEKPLGIDTLKQEFIEYPWLILRVGAIAAIEHFTGILGQWCMDNKSWDESNADSIISDLFKWHLAEEVEHRTVAYDVFAHLVPNKYSFYASRQILMVIVFPLFLYLLMKSGKSVAQHDSDSKIYNFSKKSILGWLFELERVGRKTKNVPTFSLLFKSTLRWMSPNFHPEHERNTEQALAYLNRSNAVQAAIKAS